MSDALVAQLRALHAQTWESVADEVWKQPGVCSHDGFTWPCATIGVVDAQETRSTPAD